MNADPVAFNPRPFWTATKLAEFLVISRVSAYRLLDDGAIR